MEQLEQLLQRCVVKLSVSGRGGWGTGFFVAPGLILTCAHVVKAANGEPIRVRWQGWEDWAEAVVERSVPEPDDLALLRFVSLAEANLPCVALDGAIQSRDPLYLFGFPDQDFDNGCPVTFSCEGLTGDQPPLIKFALGQVRPGMSGSPLLNQRSGKVCGMVKFTRDRSMDLGGGAIPVSAILAQFPELVALQQQFHQHDLRWSRSIAALLDAVPENLPHSGVVEFVGRAEAMAQLDQMLQQGDRVAVSAIAGMGGMGKTELALQYALAHQQQYAAGICWLQARGAEVGTQLVRFAQSQLSLNPPDTFELLDQVKYCWRNWRSGPVLLIFDDVTDYEAIEPYLPPSTETRFKVLLTTRLRLGRSVNQLALDVLEEAAALALLQSLVGGDRIAAELDQAQLLCEQLGFLPLGLELVGRYVDRKPDLSLVEMRRRLQAKQLAAQALCQTDADMTAQLGVAAAFQLSWEALSQEAKQLGYLLSLFAAAPIAWSLVEQCCEDRDPEDLEEIRDSELLNLHLLQRVAQATYRLHPLIREFFGAQLEQYQEMDGLKQQFCHVMATAAKQIPERATREQSLILAPLIPHLARAATTLKDWLNNEELGDPYEGLGRFYEGQGAYAEAKPWYEQSLSVSRSRLGEEHPHVAQSLNNLAVLYRSQGRYSEAEPLCVQALDLHRRILGEEHPDVAQSLNNLAVLYRSQGRYSEAEPLYLQALDMRRRILGEEHLDMAQSLNNLAALYYSQGRYSEAEPLCVQALDLHRRILGEEHPDVAQSLNNLAVLYNSQGRYSEAEPLYLQSLELYRCILGEEHPDVALSLNNLAEFYRSQGRYSEAEPLYLQSLELYRCILGEEHPDVALSLNNLAVLYNSQGRYSEAEPLYLQALDLRRRILGEEHPDVAQSLNNLAVLYRSQGRYSEAEPLYPEVLNIFRKTLGSNHPNVGRVSDGFGRLQAAQRHDEVAESLFMEALEILEPGLGAAHPWTIECREHLEEVRQRMGNGCNG